MAHILDTLASLGEDLLANKYSIILPTTVSQLAGVNDQLTFRITNVSIPEKTISTYTITKRGRQFDRPSGVSEQSREISFTFRPDKKLVTYKAISNWMNYIQNNETMFMASDSGANGEGGASLFRAPIEIWAIDSLDDNIDELLVAFYSSQVYPARAPACDPLYFVLQPEDNVLVTP